MKKFPKIGDKVARQVILDLKGKLNVINTGLFKREDHSQELSDALIGLGYKHADVKKVISSKVPGDKVILGIYRNGREYNMSVVLSEYKGE